QVLARITRVAARAPRHTRSIVSPLVGDARRAALMPLGDGAERVLSELAEAPLGDQAWLRAVAAFGEVHRRDQGEPRHDSVATRLIALLLLTEGMAAGSE
ncbi:MAG: hypothetical protein M3303_08340, partial [Gemmatimonadota bacterium]|nr:hypothetical protein [Gemmatimonadota bacterium]